MSLRDGLPDRVSMNPGSGTIRVRLNLGYRFGAEEAWSLPSWQEDTTGCHDDVSLGTGFLGDLLGAGVTAELCLE